MWQEGLLQSRGLGSKEVHHLVCALFEDTDLRRDVLSSLTSEH